MREVSKIDELSFDELKNVLKDHLESMDIIHEAMNAGIWEIKFDTQGNTKNVIFSKSFRRLLGYMTEAELASSIDAWEELIHPDDKDWVMQYYWGFVDGYSDSELYEVEYRIKTKNLGWHWVRELGKLTRSDDGMPRVFHGTMIDIDEEKRLQDKMVSISRKNTENFGIINGLSQEFHVVMLLKGNDRRLYPYRIEENTTFTSAYQNAINALNYDTAMKEYTMAYVYPDDCERVMQEASFESVRANTIVNGNYAINYRRVSGSEGFTYHQAVFARAFTSDGQENYVLGFRDIDEIIQEQRILSDALEEARHANRAKTTFLNNVSHDIRTPMNGIIGYTSLALSKCNEPDKVREYLSKILTSSNHLLGLINDVLDMSRIESGTIKLHNQPVNLEVFLDEIKTIVQADVMAKSLDLKIEIEGLFDKQVLCDQLRLNQVLLNLLSNAIKFTPKGGKVEIVVSQYNIAVPGKHGYKFIVKDNGIGMSESFLCNIFNPFEREERDNVEKIQGTGLGMAITKNIVTMMGGSIDVSSRINEGTEFVIRLELENPTTDFIDDSPVEMKAGKLDFTGRRILLAEDNEINQEIAKALFESIGFEVDIAENGAIAIEMIQLAEDDYYDIILMDIQMPVKDGYETTKIIRAMDNKLKASLPIIAMTANAFEEDKRHAMDVGMNDHIAKPFSPEVLYATIAKYVSGR